MLGPKILNETDDATIPASGCFQGDAFVLPVPELPAGLTEITPTDDMHILAHSETGHHHIVADAPGVHLYSDNDNEHGMPILYLKVDNDFEIKHLRQNDTHRSLLGTPGIYKITPQRESDGTLEGWRHAID